MAIHCLRSQRHEDLFLRPSLLVNSLSLGYQPVNSRCRLLCHVVLPRLQRYQNHDWVFPLPIKYSVCLYSLSYCDSFFEKPASSKVVQVKEKYCPTPRLSLLSGFNRISSLFQHRFAKSWQIYLQYCILLQAKTVRKKEIENGKETNNCSSRLIGFTIPVVDFKSLWLIVMVIRHHFHRDSLNNVNWGQNSALEFQMVRCSSCPQLVIDNNIDVMVTLFLGKSSLFEVLYLWWGLRWSRLCFFNGKIFCGITEHLTFMNNCHTF